VLIGHSQGASVLLRLISEEIDGKPVQHQLVSAILAGGNLQVPIGKEVGGSFHHIPLCHRAEQIGCVIAYSTFLSAHPPSQESIFGMATRPGLTSACVNPGTLTDDGALDAELPTVGDVAKTLGTTFVENPGVISGACTTAGDRTYLGITIKASDSPRAERLDNALVTLDSRQPGWGLHFLDISLALGNLVEIVGREGQAWIKQGQ
jgi:hypothetical protein